MTPGARLSAAIELLDAVLAGEPAERELTRWARASRFAGSKDRAAVRDLVYDGLRRRRSLGWLGGGDTGRAIVLAQRGARDGADLDALFTGEGFDPAPVTAAERAALAARPRRRARSRCASTIPTSCDGELAASLGDDFEPVLAAMQARAPVDLRVNTLKTNPDAATVVLARDGVQVERHPLARDALRVLENPRLVAASRAYTQGMVELQDASSQVVAETAGAAPGMTVLDYCAGGGGKTLALAAALQGQRPAAGLGRQPAPDGRPARARPPRRRRGPHPHRRRVRRAEAGLRPRARRRALLGHRRLAPQARGQVAADPRRARRASRRCRTRSSTPPPPR